MSGYVGTNTTEREYRTTGDICSFEIEIDSLLNPHTKSCNSTFLQITVLINDIFFQFRAQFLVRLAQMFEIAYLRDADSAFGIVIHEGDSHLVPNLCAGSDPPTVMVIEWWSKNFQLKEEFLLEVPVDHGSYLFLWGLWDR